MSSLFVPFTVGPFLLPVRHAERLFTPRLRTRIFPSGLAIRPIFVPRGVLVWEAVGRANGRRTLRTFASGAVGIR